MADTTRNVGINFGADVAGLIRGLGVASGSLSRFVSDNESKFKRLGQAWHNSIGKLTSPIANLVTGAGILMAAKQVGELDGKVTRMGIDASMSAKQMLTLKNQLLSTAIATGASTDQMADLAKSALSSSKSTSFVNDNLAYMAKLMQASGASGAELGDALGDIYEKTGLTGKGFQDLVGTMYAFGKTTGRESTFKQLLPSVPQLLKTMKAIYPKASMKDVATFMTTSMFVGDPAIVTQAYKRMFSSKSSKMLAALGIDRKNMPSIANVVAAVGTRFAGNRAAQLTALTELFGKSALGMQKLLDEQDAYNKALKESDPAKVYTDAATAAGTLQSSLNRVGAAGMKIASQALEGPLKNFANLIEKLAADPNLDKYISNISKLAVGLGGLWVAMNAFKVGKGVFDMVNILTGGAKKGKGGLGGMGGATPVYVVNMPGGGIPGLPGGPAGTAANKIPWKSLLTGAGGVAALPVLGMVSMGMLIDKMRREGKAEMWGMGSSYYDQSSRGATMGSGADVNAQADKLFSNTVNVVIDGEVVARKIQKKDLKSGPRGQQVDWSQVFSMK